MRNAILAATLLGLASITPSLGLAQTFPKITVSITIDAPSDMEAEVLSYYQRELRSLGDVVIVDFGKGDKFHISVIVMQVKTVGGMSTGWVALGP